MTTIYFLAVIYFIIALFHAVNFEETRFRQKVKNFFAAALWPGYWIYTFTKDVIKYYKQ